MGIGKWELMRQLPIRSYQSSLFAEAPFLRVGVEDKRELCQRAYEVGRGDLGFAGQDFLGEANGKSKPYHTELFLFVGYSHIVEIDN